MKRSYCLIKEDNLNDPLLLDEYFTSKEKEEDFKGIKLTKMFAPMKATYHIRPSYQKKKNPLTSELPLKSENNVLTNT